MIYIIIEADLVRTDGQTHNPHVHAMSKECQTYSCVPGKYNTPFERRPYKQPPG